jgi:hypothetical protein
MQTRKDGTKKPQMMELCETPSWVSVAKFKGKGGMKKTHTESGKVSERDTGRQHASIEGTPQRKFLSTCSGALISPQRGTPPAPHVHLPPCSRRTLQPTNHHITRRWASRCGRPETPRHIWKPLTTFRTHGPSNKQDITSKTLITTL